MQARIESSYWLERFDAIMSTADDLSPQSLLDAIVDLGHEMGPERSDALLAEYPRLTEYARVLEAAFYRSALLAEDAEINRILQLDIKPPVGFRDVISDKAAVTYNRVVDIFSWLDFSNCERFVMIGCGQLPVSALHVHDRTGVGEIVCVDVRSEAVEDVRRLAVKLGMTKLRCELRDGKDFDYCGAQIVYIANMVKGKDAVVARILETASSPVQIVVRTPVGFGRLWTEPLNDVSRLGLRIAETGHMGRNLGRDLLLRPQDQ